MFNQRNQGKVNRILEKYFFLLKIQPNFRTDGHFKAVVDDDDDEDEDEEVLSHEIVPEKEKRIEIQRNRRRIG